MPFLLDSNPDPSEIAGAVNYLMANLTASTSANQGTGQITDPNGNVIGYLYQYMDIKYAQSYDGSVGFSDSPTNATYFGLRNNNSSVESTNPADYIWYQAAGGFGTTKYLWYQTTGGRQIQFDVSTLAPDVGWVKDNGSAINLDVVTSGNIPVVVATFTPFFTPAVLQVPRSGYPLTPSFTGIAPVMYATDGGTVIPFSGAQTDTSVDFVPGSWRIGNSATTGYGDIGLTNITIGNPTDAGDYAQWPNPTAMSNSPAYITVPVRYKNALGTVSQASVATQQFLFVDSGVSSSGIDISGYTSFAQNAGGIYTPSSATLSAILQNVVSPTYSWTISGATPTSSTASSVVVTPTSSSTGVTVTLTVNGANISSPLTKTITLPVVYDGAPGTAGANGVMSAFPTIYTWTGSSTPPTRPTTTSTYTWATGSFTPPSGWYSSAPSNTVAGNYLWSITYPVTTTATTTTSTLDWTNTTNPIKATSYNGNNGAATFVVTRSANDSSAPTDAEVNAVLGRSAVSGDICTVNYNSGNNSVVYRYITSWSLFVTYITGSLIVENTITGDKVAANTITATNIASNTITASQIASGTITATQIASGTITATQIAANSITVNEINNVATGQIIAGSFNLAVITSSTTWTVPAYVYKIKLTLNGGGGGGSPESTVDYSASGGGGGGGLIKFFTVNPGDVYTINIGGGGGVGGNGGNSQVLLGSTVICTAYGGTAGYISGESTSAGSGGSASGGTVNLTGGNGNYAGAGGASPFIGVGGASLQSASSNSGGGGGGLGSGGSGLCLIEY